MSKFNCALMGANFRPKDAQEVVKALGIGEQVFARREPANAFDPNAIQIIAVVGTEEYHIGYVERGLAEELAPFLDQGNDLHITVSGFISTLKPYLDIDEVYAEGDHPDDE